MAEWYCSHLPLLPGRYYFSLNSNRDKLEIKSNVSANHPLIKVSTATNFIYKVIGNIDDFQLNEINSFPRFSQKIRCLKQLSNEIVFHAVEGSMFHCNLLFIDSCMPQLIADCLLAYWTSHDRMSVRDITEQIASANPFGFTGNDVVAFYEHKMKVLLLDAALGMTPASEWKGHYDANGGYLVVRKDGEIVCYHFYNRNDVEDYLYNNTKFERASRSRYNFGSLYRGEDGEVYIKLNLQIRFMK